MWLEQLTYWAQSLPVAVALAAVATIGYVVGRRSMSPERRLERRSHKEIQRAQLVASELQRIALRVRKHLEAHQADVSRFKERVEQLHGVTDEDGFPQLWKEAEEILAPTQQLASRIAAAYEEIRQQAVQLMSLTEIRTDPLTGARNRRALDETLEMLLAMKSRYEQPFAIAIFDVDHFKEINDGFGHLIGDLVLQEIAASFDEATRQTDVVFRYGGEEFVITLPETGLQEALQLAERVRRAVESQHAEDYCVTVSGGVTCALGDDDMGSLLARADDALYQAKTAGRNLIYYHDGRDVSPNNVETEPVPA